MIEFNYFNRNADKIVTREDMAYIYNTLSTPTRLGAVMKRDGWMCDSPTVFRYGDRFYMYFIMISYDTEASGYETHLAVSDDLVNWEYLCPILSRGSGNGWDSGQIAGYAALHDIDLFGTNELKMAGGEYFISYLAGEDNGYEPDPLLMGLASSPDPTKPTFRRRDKPILTPFESDIRYYEDKTLYKSCIFEDDERLTGHRYVNCYNAKHRDNTERIFLAVSDDMEKWERYGRYPIIDHVTGDPDGIICGDPQIIRLSGGSFGNLYVMAYFKFKGGMGAYDTFAASYDLIRWTPWEGKPLIAPSSDVPDEDVHAHKPWIIGWRGDVYHFYCAVNSRGERYIALAVSEKR